VIIGEAKTCKNGDFAKYSSTSRQIKAYVNRCEHAGKRVAQVLIVAPTFSNDFVESAEMDTEVNISLLEAAGLKLILDAFNSRRNPNFSAKLFTKGGLLKAGLIAKNI
jgi:predicted deacetylase